MAKRLAALEARVAALQTANRLLAGATVGLLSQAPPDLLDRIAAELDRLTASNGRSAHTPGSACRRTSKLLCSRS
jgi:hypothetical protein